MTLSNKNVLITGASSGIGRACAFAFAKNGSNLVLFARRIDSLQLLKSEILQVNPNILIDVIECDVRHLSQVKNAIGLISESLKNIDILINNAGLAKGLSKIQDGDYEHWEQMIDTNIKGVLYMSREILPQMVASNKGLVINIGSIAGREVYSMGNVYCGTKHALAAISKSMAIDLNGTGVRICNIEPGMVDTEFSEVRFDGNKSKAELVYRGFEPLIAEDIAETAIFVATRPQRVMIQDILITPTAQASAHLVDRKL